MPIAKMTAEDGDDGYVNWAGEYRLMQRLMKNWTDWGNSDTMIQAYFTQIKTQTRGLRLFFCREADFFGISWQTFNQYK